VLTLCGRRSQVAVFCSDSGSIAFVGCVWVSINMLRVTWWDFSKLWWQLMLIFLFVKLLVSTSKMWVQETGCLGNLVRNFYLGCPFFSCGFGGFTLSLFYAGIWQEYQNLNKSSCFGGIFFLNGWASLSISYVPMSLLSLDLHVCTQWMWLMVMLVPGDRPKISESDKSTVRENLLEAIIQAPPIIRCILVSSTSSFAFCSLPWFVGSTILWAYSCDSWLKF